MWRENEKEIKNESKNFNLGNQKRVYNYQHYWIYMSNDKCRELVIEIHKVNSPRVTRIRETQTDFKLL